MPALGRVVIAGPATMAAKLWTRSAIWGIRLDDRPGQAQMGTGDNSLPLRLRPSPLTWAFDRGGRNR